MSHTEFTYCSEFKENRFSEKIFACVDDVQETYPEVEDNYNVNIHQEEDGPPDPLLDAANDLPAGTLDISQKITLGLVHVLLGWIIVLLQHIQFFVTGFMRHKKDFWRSIQTMVHSFVGHIMYLLCIVTAIFPRPICSYDVIIPVGLYIGIYTIAFISFTFIDRSLDNYLSVKPPRRIFPIVEPIQMDAPVDDYINTKHCLLLVTVCLMMFVWIINWVTFLVFQANAKTYFQKSTEEISLLSNLFSLFGNCHGLPRYG